MRTTRYLALIAVLIAAVQTCVPAFGFEYQIGRIYELKVMGIKDQPLASPITGKITEDGTTTNAYITGLWPMMVQIKDLSTGEVRYNMMCVDLIHDVAYGGKPWLATLRAGWDDAHRPWSVFNRDRWDQLTAMSRTNLGWFFNPAGFDKYLGAGLQAAIWEVGVETVFGSSGTYSVSNGNFRLYSPSSAISTANNYWLPNAIADRSIGDATLWFDAKDSLLDEERARGYVLGQDSLTGLLAVPELPALSLAPLGMAFLGFVRRKRQLQHRKTE